ncbi:hypothetical protein [Parasulfitobacter algicola]|uniref:Uncharacterized protein n=1 Tax=Parasulfitobacter algicola TaxID=2614809 RepID=A0ABX2IVS4_9RHOB|nr:hypothetical protein [Sulfitobacter algicola]NSX57027.1 hypothetical protein [Sulfitobacter algicola]
MRKTTKSPGEKIVKDIKRATAPYIGRNKKPTPTLARQSNHQIVPTFSTK